LVKNHQERSLAQRLEEEVLKEIKRCPTVHPIFPKHITGKENGIANKRSVLKKTALVESSGLPNRTIWTKIEPPWELSSADKPSTCTVPCHVILLPYFLKKKM
jgi:hypothetical protein